MPTAFALTSLTAAKAYLQIDTSNTSFDSLLDNLIDRVTGLVEGYTRRKFKERAYIEFIDGDGTSIVLVRNYPITSIISIHDDTNRDFDDATLIPVTDFVTYAEEGKIRLIGFPSNFVASFVKGVQNIKVVYNAGFVTIPFEIEQAAIEWIAEIFNRSREGQDGILTEGLSGHTKTFDIEGIPMKVKAKLNMFKKYFSGYRS